MLSFGRMQPVPERSACTAPLHVYELGGAIIGGTGTPIPCVPGQFSDWVYSEDAHKML